MANSHFTKVLERKLGFYDYQKIINQYATCDIRTNNGFQKLFNKYYKVRRNRAWQQVYYDLFEKLKTINNLNYNYIIGTLELKLTGIGSQWTIEASFASKMLATIKPDMPILDSQVLKNLRVNKGKSVKDAEAAYDCICKKYDYYKKYNPSGYKNALELFDEYFPDFTWVNPTRKIDYFLWSCERSELVAIGFFNGLI